MKIRTRFAPSPTGHLHIGGARTALYNFLFAKAAGGEFLVRIEDTDQARHQEEAVAAILSSMEWLGLEPDQIPLRQSQRFPIYKAQAERLLDSGLAYRCFCGRERIDALRQQQKNEKSSRLGYDGFCRSISEKESAERASNEDFVLRFAMPRQDLQFVDLVHGVSTFDLSLFDDLIILKSDDTPTYNFAVAVDDAAMGITHVIRGDDHLSNTPKQVALISALGHPLPVYAHIPMIHGTDHVKLSKRHGAVSVLEYQKMGFLPEALCNYLALLGWAFDGEQELFTRQDLLAKFSLERVSKTPSVFDQEKANWVNAQYLKKLDMSQKISLAKPWVQQVAKGKPLTDNWLENLLLALGERIKRFDEIPEQSEYLFAEITQWDEKAKKHLCKEQAMSTLEMIQKNIPTLDFSSGEKLEQQMRVLAETEEISLSKMVHPLRGALTGKSVSFGIFDVMVLLGKETVKKRLQNTMTEFSKKEK